MSSQPPTDAPQTASPEAILRALREELRAAEGRAASTAPAPTAPSADRLHELTEDVRKSWEIWPIFTSRIPVLGGLVVLIRKVCNKILARWLLGPIFQKQVEFNGSVTRLALYSEQILRSAQEEMRLVSDEVVVYDRRSLEVARSLAQLDLLLKSLDERLSQLKSAETNGSLAKIEARLIRLEGAQATTAASSTPASTQPPAPYVELPIDAFAFNQRFRGSRDAIKGRQSPYLEYFQGKSPIIDLGCGRGEFIELLNDAGITARGVDSDTGMVAYCRQLNLPVEQGDLMAFLDASADGSLGGVFAGQVIEHLPPPVLLSLFQLVYRKLRPGGVFIAETINPLCVWAIVANYTADLTHEQPVHPDTASFLAESFGYTGVEIRYSSAYPELARLQPLGPLPDGASEGWRAVLNENTQRLNGLLFTYQDYALIARKPG